MENGIVVGSMNFLEKHELYETEKPYILKYDPPKDFPKSNYRIETKEQIISDIRGRESQFSVAKNGFAIMALESKMTYEDYDDDDKIRNVYFPEVAQALQKLLGPDGAFRVQIFEHLVRKQSSSFPLPAKDSYTHPQPTTVAHIDMTFEFATFMAKQMNHQKGADLPSGRYQFINVWKPLCGPVPDWPLAVADAATLDADHILPADVVFSDFTTEHHLVQHHPGLQWYYISNQEANEAWAFLQAGSHEDSMKGSPHSSFALPNASGNSRRRESIEVRSVVYYQE